MKYPSRISKAIALLFAAALAIEAAQQFNAVCGTYRGRTQQEMFLHYRHLLARALQPRAAGASINQNAGQVVVIDDAGVIGRRNPFNLDGKTVTLAPDGAGYQIQMSGDSFDAAALQAGALLTGMDDDDTRPVALPFSFPLFGAAYRQLWISSNGLLTFTGADADFTGSYGHFLSGLPAIAPLFTDLDPSRSSDGVHVLAAPDRLVATWSNVPLAGSFGFTAPPSQTFQVRLYPDGRIEFAYRSIDLPSALVGVTPGGMAPASLVDFAGAPPGTFSGVAETFASADSVDVVAAALKFYQTHDDAYDYLVFYNSEGIAAGPGAVAYELTTRSHGQGYGDVPTEIGAEFGSPRRLKAVLNLGPSNQYPSDPNAPVPARYPTGDTPITVLGHESGHLYLALVSVQDENGGTPMLGRGQVHWAFSFNSDASLLEGNRIADNGAASSPRFATTAAVQHYSALDQYLMGFRAPQEVPPTFAALSTGESLSRPPQTGVSFGGTRMDISIDDVVNVAGRRTPDATVAQRRYRFAIVMIVPPGSNLQTGLVADAIAQVDRYRSSFENFFPAAADNRAGADTALKRSVTLSMAPAAGVLTGRPGLASLSLANPASTPVTFSLSTPNGILTAPATVSIPAGETRMAFQVQAIRDGVEELTAIPSDSSYETAIARVQASPAYGLRAEVADNSPNHVLIRVVDQNNLPYSNVPVTAAWPGATPAAASTDETGGLTLSRPPGGNTLTLNIAGTPATITAPAPPVISAVVNAASFTPMIAPGALGTVFGANFSDAVQVLLNGAPVQLLYTSAQQINFLAPAKILPGIAQLQVTSGGGTSSPVLTLIDAHTPGIFFDPATALGAIRVVGNFLEIYCTGLGAADQSVTVQIAGLDAPVTYAGTSSFPGVNQVNARIPSGVPTGTQSLSLSVGGISSNTVKLRLP